MMVVRSTLMSIWHIHGQIILVERFHALIMENLENTQSILYQVI